MLAKLLDFDWLAIAGWGGAGLLAAAAVWAFVALPTARWAWKVLGLGAAVLVTLMLFRTALSNAERRGYERAQQEAYEAAQAQAEAWAGQLEAANRKVGGDHQRSQNAAAKARQNVETEYAGNPGADRRLVADDIVRRAQADRDSISAAARNRHAKG